MTLTCPHCGFSRDVDPARIPAGAREATCPRCREKFPLAQGEAPSRNSAGEEPIFGQVACSSCRTVQPAGERCKRCGATFVATTRLAFAGFWLRVAAALIDSAAVTLLQFALGVLLSLAVTSVAELDDTALEFVVGLFGAAVAIVYYVYFTGYGGQTPGKMVLKIKVIRTDGSAVGYGRAFLREVVGKFLSGILLGIGYLMVAFDRQKQGLHDRIADTYVVKL